MTEKAPRSLLIALSVIAAGSFALSMYLEHSHLGWLQSHPISVNLLSGVVGFSTATLVVAAGFYELRLRERVNSEYQRHAEEWREIGEGAREAFDLVFTDQIRKRLAIRGISTGSHEIDPDKFAGLKVGYNAGLAIDEWKKLPIEPEEWRLRTVKMRAEGLEFLEKASEFARTKGIYSVEFVRGELAMRARLEALPQDGDEHMGPKQYFAARAKLGYFRVTVLNLLHEAIRSSSSPR